MLSNCGIRDSLHRIPLTICSGDKHVVVEAQGSISSWSHPTLCLYVSPPLHSLINSLRSSASCFGFWALFGVWGQLAYVALFQNNWRARKGLKTKAWAMHGKKTPAGEMPSCPSTCTWGGVTCMLDTCGLPRNYVYTGVPLNTSCSPALVWGTALWQGRNTYGHSYRLVPLMGCSADHWSPVWSQSQG